MNSHANSSSAVDVWSVGCILAELLGSKPFFKGRDYVDQLNQILHFLGTPSEATLNRIGSPRAQEYVRNLPYMPKIAFAQLFPRANPDALDLLDRLLAFDPSQRIGVEESLEHRYLSIWHDASDEPTCPTPFDFGFESAEEIPEMRQMILAEVAQFRQSVRAPQSAPLGQNQGAAAPGGQVPIPDQFPQGRHEDPRPQETTSFANGDLERELQGGLDAMR
jgi:mitogen-activated protein kinase 7